MPSKEMRQRYKDYYDAYDADYSKSLEKKEAGKRYYQKHKESIKRATSKYYRANRDVIRAKINEENAKIKQVVLTHYGGGKLRCIECGFDNIDCLTIDHTKDNGRRHRQKLVDFWVVHFISGYLRMTYQLVIKHYVLTVI